LIEAACASDASPKREESHFGLLFEHDLFGKPIRTFPDHTRVTASIRGTIGEDRSSVFAFVPTDSPAAIRRLGTTGKAPV
jgi:hypothetical protein